MFITVDTPKAKIVLNADQIEMVDLYESELTIRITSKEGVMRDPIVRLFDSADEANAVFKQLSSTLIK